MINCLRKYIDVWDGCSEKDPNVMYVNSIPNFTLDVAESLTTSETQSALQLIREKIDFACQRVEDDIRNSWNGKVYLGTLLSMQRAGIIQMNNVLRPKIANNYQGVQINLKYAPYVSIYVHNLQFFPKDNETVTIRVFNINTGIEIDTIADIDLNGGEVNTVTVDKEYKSDGQPLNLAFLIESIDSYDVQLWAQNSNYGCTSCRGGYNFYGPLNQYAYANQVQVPTASAILDQNIDSSISTGGMSVNYSIKCDNTDFICQIAPMMKLAMLYAAGIEIMEEIIFSRRLNTVTVIERDTAEQLGTLYQQRYKDARDGVLNNLILPKNICFQCNAKIVNNVRIP